MCNLQKEEAKGQIRIGHEMRACGETALYPVIVTQVHINEVIRVEVKTEMAI